MMFSQLVKQSPWWAAGNCSHVHFITTPLPSVYYVLHNTKFPSNVSEYKLSNNIKHSFFELDAWTKSKHTKLYWKKKSNVKTESPLGKQKSQGNLTSARFRRKMLTIQANWGAKSEIEMITTCRFKDLFLGKQMYWHFRRKYIFCWSTTNLTCLIDWD